VPDHFTTYTPDEGPLPRPGDPDSILLGRYRVIELADKGGFGNVLVCWDIRLQRRVAIKCLPITQAGSSQDEALAEARTSSFLSHPNIVTVFDFETDDDYAYIVMEYVDGVTLSEFMRRVEGGVLIWSEAAYVLKSVASALQFAHENGVLHLDIKPANVMIDYSGNVKLADFGMASLASAAGWAGARGGTVGYMPPEQLSGDLVDERTDVFSLACVTFQALTGTNPFAAETAEESLAKIEKGAPLLSAYEPELAGPVELAFLTAFSATPNGRMSDAQEFANEVIPSLGDPDEGRRSIIQLLSQDDAEVFDESEWKVLDPVGTRLPLLPGILLRVANGFSVAALVWKLGPCLGLDSTLKSVLVPLLAGAVAGLASSSGILVTMLACTFALLVPGIDGPRILLAALVAVVGTALFSWFGREEKGSAAALCLPPVFSNALASPFAAALAASPPRAAALAVYATILSWLMEAQLVAVQDGMAIWSIVTFKYLNAGTLVVLLGAGVAAAIASALARRQSKVLAWIGQGLAAIITSATILAAQSLEINGVWGPAGVQGALFTVIFPVLMVIVIALFGPPQSSRRDE
jgi:serine/threonine-protein kinase